MAGARPRTRVKRERDMLEVAEAVEEGDRELVTADGVECDVMSETACVDAIEEQ